MSEMKKVEHWALNSPEREKLIIAHSLEDILTIYFGCENPFLDEPYYDGETFVVLTEEGLEAYGKLISLLYDIGGLTTAEIDIERIVEDLDDIANEL